MTPFNPYDLDDIPAELAAYYERLTQELAENREQLLATREERWRYPHFDPEGLVLDAANPADREHPYFALLAHLLAETFVPYAEGHAGDLGLVGVVGPVVVLHKSARCGDCQGAVMTGLGVQAFLRRYFENPHLQVVALDDEAIRSPLPLSDLVGAALAQLR
jgi:Fe-S cluster biogenesis protein NfuA